jgi:hypothetical protein
MWWQREGREGERERGREGVEKRGSILATTMTRKTLLMLTGQR